MTYEISKSSLETFCDMYKKNEEEFEKRIHDPTLNQSSKNFLSAIRFLHNFKLIYPSLDIKTYADPTNLLTEVLGLAASVLQAVMNAKRLSDDEKMDLQQAFLGEQMMPCLRRYEDGRLDGDFSYVFPKLFLRQNILKQKDCFRLATDGDMTDYCTLAIDERVLGFVSKCFVNVYDARQEMTSGMGESCEQAVRKLEQNVIERRNFCEATNRLPIYFNILNIN